MNTNSKVKTAASGIVLMAALILSNGAVHAACDVKHGTAANVIANNSLGHLETDCASAADVASQGAAITAIQGVNVTQGNDIAALQTDVGTLQTNDAAQDATLTGHTSAITALQSQTAAQQTELDDHEARITTATNKNNEQDGRLDGHDTAIADHETRITANTAKNVQQDARLDGHDAAIGSLEADNVDQWNAINANSALLSQHSATLAAHGKKLEEHDRGLAIAMSLPDAWLSDKKRFGVFGAVGGFEGETALGVAAIGRIDETWTFNLKGGTDTGFKSFGWQVGAGAQW